MPGDLIAETIRQVRQDGWITIDMPDPGPPLPLPAENIAELCFPGDRPIPPSLRQWLAFDAVLLAEIVWYDDPGRPEC